MEHLGISVMLHMLMGNNGESAAALNASIGKKITSIDILNDTLTLSFEDGSSLTARDDGQSCCESRYMRTDDDLPYYKGSTLTGMGLRDAPDEEDEYGTHEVQFLVVNTSNGDITIANHNEHNGYYGGFAVVLSASRPSQAPGGRDGE